MRAIPNLAAFAAAALAAGGLEMQPYQRNLADLVDEVGRDEVMRRLRSGRTVRPSTRRFFKRGGDPYFTASQRSFNDRVRAQAGFTTRECEQLTALANKHGKSFEDVAAEARRLREFG